MPPLLRRLLPLLLASAWCAFWLIDQRFFDDDWGRWLNPARQVGWGAVLADLLRPFPADWGFLERPAVVAVFKAGDAALGLRPEPWFLLKALLGGALAAATGALAAEFGGRRAGWAATALVATAAPTFASLLWLSDSEAAAQLGVVAGLGLALRLERTGDRRLGIALLLVGVAAWKCKASGKALPLVLLGWLAVARPSGWRRVLPWALGLLALSVPWLALPSDPVPPVIAGAPADDFHWRAANADGWVRMLWGNGRLLPGGNALPYGLASLVLPFGPLALLGARRPGPAASSAWPLLLPWVGVQVAVMGSYPDIPGPLLGRYLLAASLPLAVAFGLAFAHRPRLLLLPLLLQIGLGVHDTSVRKRTQGCTIVAADRARAWIESAPAPQTAVLLDVPHTGGPQPSPHTFVSAPAGSPEAQRLLQGDVLAVSRRAMPPPWRRAQTFDARAGWVSIQGPRLASCTRTVWTKRR